jgi:hypothetical protein
LSAYPEKGTPMIDHTGVIVTDLKKRREHLCATSDILAS